MVRKYCFQIFVILNIKVILDYFADTNRELEKMKAKEKAKKGEKTEKMETVGKKWKKLRNLRNLKIRKKHPSHNGIQVKSYS